MSKQDSINLLKEIEIRHEIKIDSLQEQIDSFQRAYNDLHCRLSVAEARLEERGKIPLMTVPAQLVEKRKRGRPPILKKEDPGF